jgi:FixJ family two-component response regulator
MSTNAVVHIVDDDASVRTAIGRLLKAAGFEVASYASAGDFLMTRKEGAPGCVVLDIRMPGPTGFDLQKSLAQREDELPVIFLTGYGDIPASVRAIKAGAVDFLTKPVQRDALLGAVRNALERNAEFIAARCELHDLRSRYETLTPREREVFALVVAGRLNKQIAAELGTSERTIKAHRGQVMEKMKASSIASLVHGAIQLKVRTAGTEQMNA